MKPRVNGGGLAAAGVAGYLVGAIPTGLMVGRLAAGVDVRKFGSRVSGATNVLRAAGPGAAATTVGLDTAKGWLAARLGRSLGGELGGVVGAMAAATGHSWPLFAQFRGGRSVLTCWGSLLALDPVSGTSAALAGASTALLTRYSSLGALTGVTTAAAVAQLERGRRPTPGQVFSLFAVAFLVLRHQENLRRLQSGQERRLGEHVNLARAGVTEGDPSSSGVAPAELS
ncbi:MAG: glycerol-3-phosphate acyltransferase [Candidatus Dormibacteria bacterium]